MSNALFDPSTFTHKIYLFEYDIPSAYSMNVQIEGKTTKVLAEGYTEEDAKFFQDLRNSIIYQLKTVLKAAKNLYSSWIIEEFKLDEAKIVAQFARESLIKKGFSDYAEKIIIFPLLTNDDGFQSYENRKADFYFEYVTQTQELIEKSQKDLTDKKGKLSQISSSVWRAKKNLEIIGETKESLADKTSTSSRYNELNDLIATIQESLTSLELNLDDEKDAEKAEKILLKQKAKKKF